MKLLVIDDHHLFREGLRSVLSEEPDIEILGEAGTADQALAMVEANQPDVVLLDVSLPGADGFTVLAQIKQRAPQCKVLMLTMHVRDDYVARAIRGGAAGYALKSQNCEEIAVAIRTVARGERYLPDQLKMAGLDDVEKLAKFNTPLDKLTGRERSVFDLAAKGYSNESIGNELKISVKTVETHRARINRKLDVHNTGDLVRFAARYGALTDDQPTTPKLLNVKISTPTSSGPSPTSGSKGDAEA